MDTYIGHDWPHNPKFHDFTNFLEIYPTRDGKGYYLDVDDRILRKMKDIYQWGLIKAQTKDHELIKVEVKKLIQKIGINIIGESLVNRLWQYVSMDSQIKQMEKELSQMAEKQNMTLKDYINKQEELSNEIKKHKKETQKSQIIKGKDIQKIKKEETIIKNEIEIPFYNKRYNKVTL